MSRHDDTPASPDKLLQRYREANAHDDARPAPGLREAVLARAREQAARAAAGTGAVRSRAPAANDRSWTVRALGSLAVLGLVGLLVLQFDRGTPDEREIAFGGPHPAPAAPAPMDAAPPAEPASPAPAPQAPAAEKPAPAAPSPSPRPAPAPPSPPPAQPLERRAAEQAAPTPAPATRSRSAPATAQRDAMAPPPMAAQAPSAEAADTAGLAARSASPAPLPRLLAAALAGDLAQARSAIANGDDLDAADGNGRTALMLAAQRGHVDMVRLLLDAGADAARTDRDGLSAADLARRAGHGAVLDLL